MNQESVDIDRIVNKIYKAFDDIDRPTHDKVASEFMSMEARDVANIFRGKDWRDIDTVFLENHCIQSIFFLGFQEYRYFLPAFILASVKDYKDCFDIVGDAVATLLHPVTAQKIYQPKLYEEKESVDIYTFVCRMNGLTHKQVEVVVDFLNFLCDYHISDFDKNEPRLALDEYWIERLGKYD